MTYPAVGTPAPEFTLPTDTGANLTLSAFRGRPVVIYFYPKDDTSGCTKESCEFRDLVPRFERVNAQILGISPDGVKSHAKFRDKYHLNFPLLADEGHAVADQYGVWQEKSMYGRKYWGNARTTFVIDADGKVAHVIPKVSPKTHDDEVLKLLGELG